MIDVKINSNMKNETSVRLCVYLREIGLSLLDKNKGLPLYPVWVCVCVCWMDGGDWINTRTRGQGPN
uniref:Uncharacterized protein n=1 Tax=Daphnia magna TaxID=35525 RepID=A0A0P5S0K5_9CRUS